MIEYSDYDELNKKVLEYIISERKKNKNLTIVELVCEFAFKNDIEIEEVGDAISENEELKTIIENEITPLRNKNNILEEW